MQWNITNVQRRVLSRPALFPCDLSFPGKLVSQGKPRGNLPNTNWIEESQAKRRGDNWSAGDAEKGEPQTLQINKESESSVTSVNLWLHLSPGPGSAAGAPARPAQAQAPREPSHFLLVSPLVHRHHAKGVLPQVCAVLGWELQGALPVDCSYQLLVHPLQMPIVARSELGTQSRSVTWVVRTWLPKS